MKEIKCPKCGQPIFEDAYVCIHCQTKIKTCFQCHQKTTSGTACPKCKTPYAEHFLTETTEADLQAEQERIANWEKFNTKGGVEEKDIYKRWKEKSKLNKFLGYSSPMVHGLLIGAGLFLAIIAYIAMAVVITIGQEFGTNPMIPLFLSLLTGFTFLCIAGFCMMGYSAKNIALYIVAPLQMAKMATEENLNFTKSYIKSYSDKMSDDEIFSMECTIYAAMLMTNKKKYLPYIILAVIKKELGEISFFIAGCIWAFYIFLNMGASFLAIPNADEMQSLMFLATIIEAFTPLMAPISFFMIMACIFGFYYIPVYTGCGTIYRRKGWKLFFITYGLRRLRGMYMRKLVKEWYGTYFPENYFVGTSAQYCVKYK